MLQQVALTSFGLYDMYPKNMAHKQ